MKEGPGDLRTAEKGETYLERSSLIGSEEWGVWVWGGGGGGGEAL